MTWPLFALCALAAVAAYQTLMVGRGEGAWLWLAILILTVCIAIALSVPAAP